MNGDAQVLLGGSGGQGLVLAGIILAQAALECGYHVAQTQQYGIASRGGFSGAGVVMSKQPVLYPFVTEPSAVVCLSVEAIDKYCRSLPGHVPVLYDSRLGRVPLTGRGHPLPIHMQARALRMAESANIVSLGALTRHLRAVDLDSLSRVISQRFSGPVRDANLQALLAGWELEEEHHD
ncbi:MAG: 2-oxoacid:acceptor oxidoreductase family protein [Bacillota bacterium]